MLVDTEQLRKYRSPGRINLIGEHTDYNSGFVLPGAVDMHLIFEVRPSEDALFHFHSKHFDEVDSCNQFGQGFDKRWSIFFGQVIHLMHKKGHVLKPIYCSFEGTLPIGAGMSSSSALTCGLIYALNDHNSLGISTLDMMYLASEAERGSGLDGGKMDQYSILFGEANAVLLLDCQSYTHRKIHVDLGEYTIVLFDTRVTHELLDSGYNDRHADCKRGLKQLKAKFPELNTVRDITIDQLQAGDALLDPVSRERLNYVIEENDRVQKVVRALEDGKVHELGTLMYEGHEGLRRKYEVSCDELDFIVDWTKDRSEVLGARMMGGGFGGCVIAIVKKDQLNSIFDAMNEEYQERFTISAAMHKIKLSQGVERVL
ncbi:MAG: galactokinase [Saprospiraceae bacterium]|jgi:galactokinase